MPSTLAFDVYGTLVDTAGVTFQLTRRLGDRSAAFAARWRDKQLEYSFRRGLMRNYCTFAVCTRQALDYCCEALGTALDEGDKQALIAALAEHFHCRPAASAILV
jgi:2-haloacid dehalogenase